MSDYKKTDVPNMVIDARTGAIINTDLGAYQSIKASRQAKKAQLDLLNRVMRLEEEMKAIKAKLGG